MLVWFWFNWKKYIVKPYPPTIKEACQAFLWQYARGYEPSNDMLLSMKDAISVYESKQDWRKG